MSEWGWRQASKAVSSGSCVGRSNSKSHQQDIIFRRDKMSRGAAAPPSLQLSLYQTASTLALDRVLSDITEGGGAKRGKLSLASFFFHSHSRHHAFVQHPITYG
eukprot:scaffold18531_cov44-Cyclotella_meneghiniana.AAC.4